jgi:hypothetical protein
MDEEKRRKILNYVKKINDNFNKTPFDKKSKSSIEKYFAWNVIIN